MLFFLSDCPEKLTLEKIKGILITLHCVSTSSSQLQRISFFYQKQKQIPFFSQNRWEYINSSLKHNAITFSENSNTQENIRISRLKKRLLNIERLQEKIQPEIKPMIENLQGKFYQLEKYNEKVLRCMFLS